MIYIVYMVDMVQGWAAKLVLLVFGLVDIVMAKSRLNYARANFRPGVCSDGSVFNELRSKRVNDYVRFRGFCFAMNKTCGMEFGL